MTNIRLISFHNEVFGEGNINLTNIYIENINYYQNSTIFKYLFQEGLF